MALTNIQREVCRVIAKQRIASGESYVAGGAALNTLLLQCDSAVQPLGYLAWAATGKDPGLAPDAILQEAGRSARYSAVEIAALAFNGPAPDAAALSHQWHAALENATQIVATLPYQNVGQCVLRGGEVFRGDGAALREVLASGETRFHAGSIRGAFPQII